MKSHNRFRDAFTLVELLVVIGIIALLIAILLPSLSKARKQAQTVQCLSNQRQIALSMIQYANDNRGMLPAYGDFLDGKGYMEAGHFWYDKLARYVSPAGDLKYGINYMRCPANDQMQYATYGVNYGISYFSSVFAPWAEVPQDIWQRRDWAGSQKLSRLHHATYLTADILQPPGVPDTAIYSPYPWPLDVDTDADGVKDSNNGVYTAMSPPVPYNHLDPRHPNRNVVCSFADGSARTVPLGEWVDPNNKDKHGGIWGPVPSVPH